MYTIMPARPGDLPLLPAIELAAATLLAGQAPATILAETTSQADLQDARRRGHLWVALADGAPVGFAHVQVLEPGVAHLEEIDVHPEHGRRRLGTRLVMTVCSWAASQGYSYVTLTTFREVPWNMPFYAGLGFEEIPPEELSPALRLVIADETRRGLDPTRRAAMRHRCNRAPESSGPGEQRRTGNGVGQGQQDDRHEVPQQVMSAGVVAAHELCPERTQRQAGKCGEPTGHPRA